MPQKQKLFDSEYRLASIVWETGPIQSGELCKICEQRLGWKRTTTLQQRHPSKRNSHCYVISQKGASPKAGRPGGTG